MSSSKMTSRTFFLCLFLWPSCKKNKQKTKQNQKPQILQNKMLLPQAIFNLNYNARIWAILMHQYGIFLLSQIFHPESFWWLCHAQFWCSENWVFSGADGLYLFSLPSCPNRNVRKQWWLCTCHLSDLLHDWLEIPWVTGNVKLLFSPWRYYLNKWGFLKLFTKHLNLKLALYVFFSSFFSLGKTCPARFCNSFIWRSGKNRRTS